MRIFISAGEPSGDLHGANLIHALRRCNPSIECVGFGGERMTAAGATLLYPLCRLAVMWFLRVLLNAHVFIKLLVDADRYFRSHRPDAVVLIDFPGFNWWVARRARAHGIPVFYFVPPQLWAWAGWRVKKMRRYVNHVLSALPFEESWYRERGVQAQYIGHPYFDELCAQQLNAAFVEVEQERGGRIVALLPGSRNQELDRNLGTLFESARRIHAARPDTRFLVACFKAAQRERVQREAAELGLPIEAHAGRTAEIIHLAHSCIAVSGSVGLELLYRGKPSCVLYRIGRLDLWVGNLFKMVPYISLVNLLAGKELIPEYLTSRCEAEAISGHVLRWLDMPEEHERVCRELARLRDRVAEPGACDRAARYVVDVLRGRTQTSRAA